MSDKEQSTTQIAIGANLAALSENLSKAAKYALEGHKAMEDGEQNQAIGSISTLKICWPKPPPFITPPSHCIEPNAKENSMKPNKTNPTLENIAKNILGVDTLVPRNSDSLDFFEANVWNVAEALEAAFAAGQLASTKKHQKRMSDGGGYLATIQVSYADLVAAFGKPSKGDQYKTEAEWTILFPKTQKITIYNYKNSQSYASICPDIEQVTQWHIGGNNAALVNNILGMLAGNAKLIHKTGE